MVSIRKAPRNVNIEEEDSKNIDALKRSSLLPKTRNILIVDDDTDITTTFKMGLENIDKTLQVHTYDNPLAALSDFKPNYYDLLLVDINMPMMNGFELCEKILDLDVNVRVCFMSAGEINQESLREWHLTKNIGCFIKKPIAVDDLFKRLSAELG